MRSLPLSLNSQELAGDVPRHLAGKVLKAVGVDQRGDAFEPGLQVGGRARNSARAAL
jgi:hypothetical protein